MHVCTTLADWFQKMPEEGMGSSAREDSALNL